MKNKFTITFVMILALMIFMTSVGEAAALGNRMLYFGTRGRDVKALQNMLASKGYFHVEPTGYYGPITERAIIEFQKNYNLRIDGFAGYETIRKLKGNYNLNISNSNYRLNVTAEEMDLLLRTVYSEARGESFEGQVAVASVVINRVLDDRFPDTIKGVVFQPWAFTAVHDGQFWLDPDPSMRKAVEAALKGWDPTGGAVFYYNPAKVTSYWIYTRPIITRIGRHFFAA
ncbi:N-acetylmuramoyl-L-alanine amidase [Orenia metallireducens]|uniref:N-acetylmuramoyl-L-alanine amidase n=1 Tax=Orenia metallireducens TaxID=1413210 RepID=A0A285G7X4_9FIRM|nr:cell wall hydrolase [Orenia metallireducens]PRX24191.1 N-acetylmuramoyl-L-alanine amidase [Orenia metallireducens]SNY19659.1 N-acetylmuramoyl-L-alanine amidase [Orenia metallireducens]